MAKKFRFFMDDGRDIEFKSENTHYLLDLSIREGKVLSFETTSGDTVLINGKRVHAMIACEEDDE